MWLSKEIEQLSHVKFDQLKPSADFLRKEFTGEDWQVTFHKLRNVGVRQILPTSENGIRNLAAETMAELSGLNRISIPGGDRELSWKQYLGIGRRYPDPLEYQSMVVSSKHNRVRRMSPRLLNMEGIKSTVKNPNNVLTQGFDTVIFVWDEKYSKFIPREKPTNDEEALRIIWETASGVPFIVSTYCRVDSFYHVSSYGEAATILPMRVGLGSQSERERFIEESFDLYRAIKEGNRKPWKVTPAAPSTMHPHTRDVLQVCVDPTLRENVLPNGFYKMGEVENPMGQVVYFGPETDGAYKHYANGLINKYGFVPMNDLQFPLSQRVGMIPSGYSDVGLHAALNRFVERQPVTHFSYNSILRLEAIDTAMAIAD